MVAKSEPFYDAEDAKFDLKDFGDHERKRAASRFTAAEEKELADAIRKVRRGMPGCALVHGRS